jgi:hypothetical protein
VADHPSSLFSKICVGIAALWFLLLYPSLNLFFWDHLPQKMRSTHESCDFSQYYSGAMVARYGLWDCLYPVASPEIYGKEPKFKPLIHTPLFQESDSRKGNWNFYPQINLPKCSSIAPRLSELCDQLQGGFHYAYPPPLALLLEPLAFLNYERASDAWFTLMCFSYFGMGFYASRIFRSLQGGGTKLEGFIAMLPMIPTFLSSTMSCTFEIGNVSPLLGFLITLFAYSWIQNRQILLGIGMIPLLLFKGIGLTWCPLFFMRPVKFKTLLTLSLLTLLLNLSFILMAGVGPYQVFFTEIVPKANLSLGVGLQGLILTLLGVDPKRWIMALNILLLALLYLGYWRGTVRSGGKIGAVIPIATLAGTMAIFCICNPIVWPHHYFVNYLQLPFAGWILWEANRAQGLWKNTIWIIFSLSVLFWMDGLFLTKTSYLMEWIRQHNPAMNVFEKARSAASGLVVYVLPIMESVFLLGISYRRLLLEATPKQGQGLSDRNHVPAPE